MDDIRKAVGAITTSGKMAPAPKPTLPAVASRWTRPDLAGYRIVLCLTDETVDLLDLNRTIERVKRSDWPGAWSPYDPAPAPKPSLPAIGSTWKHSGRGEPRLPLNGWRVVRIDNLDVRLERGIATFTMSRRSWPGEWSPDEEAVSTAERKPLASRGPEAAKPTAYEHVKKLLDEKKIAIWSADPGCTRPSSCATRPGTTVRVPELEKACAPLSPAEAVERAVREAPSSLNKEALRAALVGRFDGFRPYDLPSWMAVQIGILTNWIPRTEADLEKSTGGRFGLGPAYLRALAAIQAPKMHRPARWTGGCDKGRSPR